MPESLIRRACQLNLHRPKSNRPKIEIFRIPYLIFNLFLKGFFFFFFFFFIFFLKFFFFFFFFFAKGTIDEIGEFNLLNANFTKWSNTLKLFVDKLPTNCLSVFDHIVGLALKGLSLRDNDESPSQYNFATSKK